MWLRRLQQWTQHIVGRTFISRCTTFLEWMKATPSQICRAKQTHAFSVNTKSSLTALSNSSPPYTLYTANITISLYTVHHHKFIIRTIWILLVVPCHFRAHTSATGYDSDSCVISWPSNYIANVHIFTFHINLPSVRKPARRLYDRRYLL